MTATAGVFDAAVLHYVELEVAEADLPLLVPFRDEYVRARVVYDGTAVDEVGVRIKGHSSAQTLEGKPGFTVKTNAFVKGRTLQGFKKLSLNNAVQDASGMHEHLSYLVWRTAGVAARRTAFARLTINGTFYGVYTVAEAYDGAFLEANFGDDSGNLYEGAPRVDVIDAEDLELQTNEEEDDRSDVLALREVVLGAPDEELEAALEPLVDLDAFLTYWAVEAVVNHWDGYAAQRTDGLGEPNNYYVYCDPADGRFVFIPHGADQTMTGVDAPVTALPAEGSRLALRLANLPSVRARYRERVREVLAAAWDVPALLREIDAAYALVGGSVSEESARRPKAFKAFRDGVAELRDFVGRRRAAVLFELDAAEPE
jgi:spore coat protein H